MRTLLIILSLVLTTPQAVLAWSFKELGDKFNEKQLWSCVEDRKFWSTKLAELCFMRIMETNTVHVMLMFDSGAFCKENVQVSYQIDDGRVHEWISKFVRRDRRSALVLLWDWDKAKSIENGKKITFRLSDSCGSFNDYTFDIRGSPPVEVLCCY